MRVVALTGSGEGHLVRSSAERSPRLGDIGTVVDIADRLGGVGQHYTVVSTYPELRPGWLAVFAAHELERMAEQTGEG